MGDFKELNGFFIQKGYKTTIDPGAACQAILTTAAICQAVPVREDCPLVVKLGHRLSDIKVKRQLPGARFAFTNDELMAHLDEIAAENRRGAVK